MYVYRINLLQPKANLKLPLRLQHAKMTPVKATVEFGKFISKHAALTNAWAFAERVVSLSVTSIYTVITVTNTPRPIRMKADMSGSRTAIFHSTDMLPRKN